MIEPSCFSDIIWKFFVEKEGSQEWHSRIVLGKYTWYASLGRANVEGFDVLKLHLKGVITGFLIDFNTIRVVVNFKTVAAQWRIQFLEFGW